MEVQKDIDVAFRCIFVAYSRPEKAQLTDSNRIELAFQRK